MAVCELLDALDGKVPISGLSHFQPSHATEITRAFRKREKDPARWSEAMKDAAGAPGQGGGLAGMLGGVGGAGGDQQGQGGAGESVTGTPHVPVTDSPAAGPEAASLESIGEA